MTLGDYLAAAGRLPWRDGAHDCATFPADWVMLRGHADPMAEWRGAYADAAGAQAIIDEAASRGQFTGLSGLEKLWTDGCWNAGIPELWDKGPGVGEAAITEGDVGIIRVIGEQGAVENGGIFTGRRWAFLAPRGLFVSTIDPAHVLRVWRP